MNLEGLNGARWVVTSLASLRPGAEQGRKKGEVCACSEGGCCEVEESRRSLYLDEVLTGLKVEWWYDSSGNWSSTLARLARSTEELEAKMMSHTEKVFARAGPPR